MTTPTLRDETLVLPVPDEGVPRSQRTAIDPWAGPDPVIAPGAALRRPVVGTRWLPAPASWTSPVQPRTPPAPVVWAAPVPARVTAPAPAPRRRRVPVRSVRTPRARRKHAITGYALWLFFGVFGAHQFYLDRTLHGVLYLLLLLLSPFTLFTSLPLLGLLLVLDAFLIPRFARRANRRRTG